MKHRLLTPSEVALLCCRKQLGCMHWFSPYRPPWRERSLQINTRLLWAIAFILWWNISILLGAVSVWTIPPFQRRRGATEWCDDYENVCNYSLRTWRPGGQRVFAVTVALRSFKIICPEGLLIYSFYLMLCQLWLFYPTVEWKLN